jgi:NAD(P)-dependent dehydrogenase (short-subunit alcohol dehydrogenase family)
LRVHGKDFNSALVEGIEMVPITLLPPQISGEKVAVITGAGSGIGQAVTVRLSQGGWVIVLVGQRMAPLEETQGLLFESNRDFNLCVQADVSQENDVKRLFAKVEQQYGKVDLLFNNAGINSTAANFLEADFGDFERVMKTNVGGPFLCARASMRLMAKTGSGG